MPDALWAGFCMRDGVCGAGAWAHVFARMGIHLACASGLTLLALTAWNELAGRGFAWRLRGYSLFVLPMLIALLFVFLREPADVGAGDAVGKSYFDLAGWAAGCVLSVVGLWRLSPRIEIARKTIEEQRAAMKARRLS